MQQVLPWRSAAAPPARMANSGKGLSGPITSFIDVRYVRTIALQTAAEDFLSKPSVAYAWAVRGTAGNVLKTGQTVCYDSSGSANTALPSCTGTGQDGDKQTGFAWDAARFTANSDGTITDRATGLTWLKNANCPGGKKTFADALVWSNSLAAGSCGLSDGSTAGSWRLPNRTELTSLFNHAAASVSGNLSG